MSGTMCFKENPNVASRFWCCSLPPGHEGEHRAHDLHDPKREYDAWPNDDAPTSAPVTPTPLDPVLVTLAAAALTGLLAGPKIDGVSYGQLAVEIAHETRAALGKATQEGESK